MGSAQATISIFSALPNFSRTARASLSSQTPFSRSTKRKNTLRPKILETLRKPLQPPVPISLPQQKPFQEHLQEPLTNNNLVSEDENTVLSGQSSSALVEMNHVVSEAFNSRSVFQIIFAFLGLFIFQTVCAVWVYGSLDEKRGNQEEEGDGSSFLRSEMEKKSDFDDFLLNRNLWSSGKASGSELGQVPSLDEFELEEKISKIKVMAREVRESERKKSVGENHNPSLVGEDNVEIGLPSKLDSSVSKIKTQVQKQVKRRLNKLQKKKAPKSGVGKVIDMKDSTVVADNGSVAKLNSITSESNPRGFGESRANGKIDENIKENVGDNADENVKENRTSLRIENNAKAMYDLKQKQLLDLPVTDLNASGSLAMNEYESYCLRDEVFKQVASKVLANELAGRDPFAGLDSEDEINFFRALDRKFKREGESAMKWMETRVKNFEIDSSELNSTSQESPSDSSMDMHEMERLESGRGTSISRNLSGSQTFQGYDNSIEGSYTRITRRGLEPHLSRSFTKDDEETSTISRKQVISVNNGASNLRSQTREVGKKSMHNEGNDKISRIENESDLWWQNLPYVLVIAMSRGTDSKHPKGFFSLKMHHLDVETPCTIAFEDRGDATNFCYLLETFFEDLGDFGADVVPLSIKELEKAVKSDDAKKITVVRKGQLQLYAGKPLEEVEMDLRSIWNQTNH